MNIVDCTTNKSFNCRFSYKYMNSFEDFSKFLKKFFSGHGDIMVADSGSKIPERIETDVAQLRTWGPCIRTKEQLASIIDRPVMNWVEVKKSALDSYYHRNFDKVIFTDSDKILIKPCWNIPLKFKNGIPYYA